MRVKLLYVIVLIFVVGCPSKDPDSEKQDSVTGKSDRAANKSESLIRAARKGSVSDLKVLLQTDIEPKDTNLGARALGVAAESGHNEAIKFLLGKKIDINSKNSTNGKTALIVAAENGHTKTVKMLWENGADINAKDEFGQNALRVAAENGHDKTAVQLFECKANEEVIKAVKSGNLAKVESLLEKGIFVNGKLLGRTALMSAAENGHVEIVKLLLLCGADIKAKDEFSETALTLARKNGHAQIVEILSGNASSEELIEAAKSGDLLKVKDLLHAGANVDVNILGITPLWVAVANDHIEIVKYLLEAKADVNAKHTSGQTVLWLAATKGQKDVVKLLVDANAHVNAMDIFGKSALYMAVWGGHTETVKLLLESGANGKTRDAYGVTALSIAVSKDYHEIIKLLEK